jgi:hypothetical protein
VQVKKPTYSFASQEGVVPRFYFDVREGTSFTSDDEGLEFESLDGAEHMAAESAAEIGRDRLPQGGSREVTVEVRNEHGQRVLTVTVSMEIRRVEPPPQPRAGETLGRDLCGNAFSTRVWYGSGQLK